MDVSFRFTLGPAAIGRLDLSPLSDTSIFTDVTSSWPCLLL